MRLIGPDPKMRLNIGAVAVIAVLGGCADVHRPGLTAGPDTGSLARAEMVGADGAAAGSASLFATGDALSLAIDVYGIPPGPHGLHLHASGRCDLPDFTTAGGHLNPGARQHGLDNPLGSHLGDLPNLVASADGRASLVLPLGGSRSDTLAALLDADGSALMIHAGPDDGVSDPAGNAGPRIACGVLQAD